MLKPSKSRVEALLAREDEPQPGRPLKTQEEMLSPESGVPLNVIDAPLPDGRNSVSPVTVASNSPISWQSGSTSPAGDSSDISLLEPKPPKILMQNPHAIPLELRSQIQLYATTE